MRKKTMLLIAIYLIVSCGQVSSNTDNTKRAYPDSNDNLINITKDAEEFLFNRLVESLTILNNKIDTIIHKSAWTIGKLTFEEIEKLKLMANNSFDNATALTKLHSITTGKTSHDYLNDILDNANLVDHINRFPYLSKQNIKDLGFVDHDLQVKRKFAANNSNIAFENIDVTVRTVNTSGNEVKNYEVYYVKQRYKDSIEMHKTFPEYSSTTTKPLPPGYYYFWTKSLNPKAKPSHQQWREVDEAKPNFKTDISTDD